MADADNHAPLLTEDVRELLRLMSEGDIAEVLIKRGSTKIHIKRASAQPQVVPVVASTAAPAALPAAFLQPAVPAVAGSTAGEETAASTTDVIVTAPMVGTFFAAPSPKDPPYVQPGDEVRPGDVLGIIEAMKIMNEIECEIAGIVREVLVENGQPVEYGQPLLIIDPL